MHNTPRTQQEAQKPLALDLVSDVVTLPLRLDTKSRDVVKLGTSVCISLQLESSVVHTVTPNSPSIDHLMQC